MRYGALALIVGMVTGCGESSFSSSGSTTQATSADAKPKAKVERDSGSDLNATTSESFTLERTQLPVDLVWVIDNSMSMTEENAHVQANLDSFVASVAGVADLRMAVISAAEGALAVKLSDELKSRHNIQIAQFVGSTNLLAIAAAATCDDDATERYVYGEDELGGSMKICGETIESVGRYGFLEDAEGVYSARGKLRDFFRPNAAKVYVFVTDDDADFVTHEHFLDLVSPALDGATPVVHSFQALTDNACEISNVGDSYSALADATKGDTYDLCASDWSDHFSRLTKSVKKTANASVTLASPAKRVVSVTVDGKKIPASSYSVSKDGTVELAKEILEREPREVEVVYLPI